MANVDNPNGFKPIGTMSGAPWTGYVMDFRADGSGSDLFPGDLVIMEADGNIDIAAAGSTELLGVVVGFVPAQEGSTNGVSDHFVASSTPNLNKTYYDASVDGAAWIKVCVGPDVLYEAQEDSAGTTLAYTAVGANVDVLATAGSTVKGISQQELDRSTLATTAAQLRIVRPVNRVDNEVGSDHSRWVVRINENHYTKLAGI